MTLYAESSAVLAWLLDEEAAPQVRTLLAAATAIITSDLTLIECDRVLIRAMALGDLTEAQAATRRAHLIAAAAHWHLLRVAPEIVARARQPFPGEPIRTLDALHLASALVAAASVPDLDILSLDDRIRTAAQGLGFVVQPG